MRPPTAWYFFRCPDRSHAYVMRRALKRLDHRAIRWGDDGFATDAPLDHVRETARTLGAVAVQVTG
jgi:hypothetical protein